LGANRISLRLLRLLCEGLWLWDESLLSKWLGSGHRCGG
jgi:hypothetical protein